MLYPALQKAGFATGTYGAHANDGFALQDARITNAVRCVPPENKPTGVEIANCRPFLADEIAAMPNVSAVLSLGLVSHRQVVSVLKARQADHPFAHGAVHRIGRLALYDSYHCSRYNMNTGRLTIPMFDAVFVQIASALARG